MFKIDLKKKLYPAVFIGINNILKRNREQKKKNNGNKWYKVFATPPQWNIMTISP